MGCGNPPSVKSSMNIDNDVQNNNSHINLELENKINSDKQISQYLNNKNENQESKKIEREPNKKLNEIKNRNKIERKENENRNEINQIEYNNDLKANEKKKLLQLELDRLEEEKKKKEKEEIEKKEKEKRERKEREERERQEFERQEKERQKRIKKEAKEKYEINLYLLLKNLEAINDDIEKLREGINEIFNSMLDNFEGDYEKNKKLIIDKVLDKIKDYLGFKDDKVDSNIIKNILVISFEERNIDQFKDYLNVIINSVKNYYNLKNENSIINRIIDYLSEKEELKEELEKKYSGELKIIKYDDFSKILKAHEVAMPDILMEYLIFKMKSTKPKNYSLQFEELNVNEFLEFFKEENKKEDNSINIGFRIRE